MGVLRGHRSDGGGGPKGEKQPIRTPSRGPSTGARRSPSLCTSRLAIKRKCIWPPPTSYIRRGWRLRPTYTGIFYFTISSSQALTTQMRHYIQPGHTDTRKVTGLGLPPICSRLEFQSNVQTGRPAVLKLASLSTTRSSAHQSERRHKGLRGTVRLEWHDE